MILLFFGSTSAARNPIDQSAASLLMDDMLRTYRWQEAVQVSAATLRLNDITKVYGQRDVDPPQTMLLIDLAPRSYGRRAA